MPSVAEKNNNPLNVKDSIRWRGMIGGDERHHAIFKDVLLGMRAGLSTICAKVRNGKPTLRLLIGGRAEENWSDGWAGKDDTVGSIPGRERNDPVGYATFLGQRLHVGIDEDLRLFSTPGPASSGDLDIERLTQLAWFMAEYETGRKAAWPRSRWIAATAILAEDMEKRNFSWQT